MIQDHTRSSKAADLHDTVSLTSVGTWPVTEACSVP